MPVLGVCSGLQEVCHSQGGKVEAGTRREFGHAELKVRLDVKLEGASSARKARGRSILFKDIGDEVPVWMSHGDVVTELPPGIVAIASSSSCEMVALEDHDRHIYGVQFHPEAHTPSGAQLINNFVNDICGCPSEWIMYHFAKIQVDQIMLKLQGKEYVDGAARAAHRGPWATPAT
jgi:GMP synthase (glutamine-hydrolysing)